MKHFFSTLVFALLVLPAFAQSNIRASRVTNAYTTTFDPPKASALGEAAPAINGGEATVLYSQKVAITTLATGTTRCAFMQAYSVRPAETIALRFDNANAALLSSLAIALCKGTQPFARLAISDFETQDGKTFVLRKPLPDNTVLDNVILYGQQTKPDAAPQNLVVQVQITAINVINYNLNH